MNWPQWLTVEKVLSGLVVACIPGAFTLAYQFQQARIDDRDKMVEKLNKQIESLTSAKTWDVPETIVRLTDISKKLQSQFASIDELKALRNENEALLAKISSLTKEDADRAAKLRTLAENNEALEQALKKAIVSDEVFTLKQGESAQLIKNHLVVGVRTVYQSSGIVAVLGNKEVSMNVGDVEQVRAFGKQCQLTLSRSVYPEASFSFMCF